MKNALSNWSTQYKFLTICQFFLACANGCATIPDGELQLGPKIVRDMRDSRTGTQALNKGRPIYIEARSYPQILDSGDIWAGGSVLLNVGREDLSLDHLLNPESPVTAKSSVGKAGAGEGRPR